MRSVLRRVGKRKKSRRLGEVEVISREEYSDFDGPSCIDSPGADARARDARGHGSGRGRLPQGASMRGRRHGSNHGWACWAARADSRSTGSQYHGARDPGVRYEALSGDREGNELLLNECCTGSPAATTRPRPSRFPGRSVCRVRASPSRRVRRSRQFQERLSGEDVSPCFWTARRLPMRVVALGVTISGEKRFLGFVETDTENEKVKRGLDISRGLRCGQDSVVGPWYSAASGTSARTW